MRSFVASNGALKLSAITLIMPPWRCRSVKSAALSSLRKRTFGVHGTGSGVPSALDMTKHIGTRRAEIQLLAAFVCQPIAGGTEQ